MYYVGLDVHLRRSSLEVLDHNGSLVRRMIEYRRKVVSKVVKVKNQIRPLLRGLGIRRQHWLGGLLKHYYRKAA